MKKSLDKMIAMIVLCAILGVGIFALAAYFVIPGEYTADSTVRVISTDENAAKIDTKLFAAALTSREAIESVKEDANIKSSVQNIQNDVKAAFDESSDVIKVEYSNKSAKKAQTLVGGLVSYLENRVSDFGEEYKVQIVEKASIPTEKNVNWALYIILGAIIGAAAGYAIYYFKSNVSQLAVDEDEVAKLLGVPVLAVVPDFNKKTKEYGKSN